MVSKNDLSRLPSPAKLEAALRYCAMLDIVMCDKEWLRCFTFDSKWSANDTMARYDDGEGNHLFALFTGDAAIIKGFDHESPVSPHAQDEYAVWPGIYDDVPSNLFELLDDPAFERDDVTFCVWHCARGWEAGNPVFANGEDDGSSYLLGILYTTAKSYCEWAKAYYERAVSLSAVQAVYNGATITSSLVAELNPSRDPSQALAELAQQGLSE